MIHSNIEGSYKFAEPFCHLQDLADKIASLHAAIDDVSAQLKAQDTVSEPAASTATAS
jgi:hypothetical protein